MNKIDKAFLLYLPVLHQGYLDWFAANLDVKQCFVVDVTQSTELDYLRKDVRALKPQTAREILENSGRFEAVSVISVGEVAELRTAQLYVPDDDVTAVLEKALLPSVRLHKYPVFLRWHRDNVRTQQAVADDATIAYTDIPSAIRSAMQHEATKSTDWWRRVGAVLSEKNTIKLTAFNKHIPTAYTPFIDGDMRMNLSRGDGIELVGTEHAEASLLAEAASQGMRTSGLDLYVSTFPCPTCAKFIAHAGIANVYYEEGYALGNGADALRAVGTKIIRITDAPTSARTDADRPYPEKQ